MKRQSKTTPVVAVLNMKGGVGKTTVSAHLFRVLFNRIRSGIALIDFDPQFNLSQTLFTSAQYDELKKSNKTVLSAMEQPPSSSLFDIKPPTSPPPRPGEIGVTKFVFNGTDPIERLLVVPGDFDLIKYSLMTDEKKLDLVRGRFLDFIDYCREDFKVVCIDCNPSSSFLTLCALRACTHVLVPVRPDLYSLRGLNMLDDFISRVPAISPKPAMSIVLNGIPRTGYDPTIEDQLRASVFGVNTLAAKVYRSDILAARSDYTGFATDKVVPWKDLLDTELTAVADELAPRLGLKKA